MDLDALIEQRWIEACEALGLSAPLYWEIKGGYPHFRKKRGYAVCFFHDNGLVSMQFAPKTRRVPKHRADALVRHEIGHAIDFYVPGREGDRLFLERFGHRLPQTPERRADAIAFLIWGDPIKYDRESVQSLKNGTYPRPEHLGL